MRHWAGLALILWLLTGLISAPAVAFGMTCHGSMNQMAMSQDMPMTMVDHASMKHQSMPSPDKDTQHKPFACAVHCLGLGAGFPLPQTETTEMTAAIEMPAQSLHKSLTGQVPDPLIQPPRYTVV